MTAGSERVPIDHTDRRVEVRVDVCISGKFALANKRDAKGDRRKFACRATNISQSAIVLLTPIAGAIGERVIAYFDEFGELNGAISRIFVGGFVMRTVANNKDRAKFREKLLWLQASNNLQMFDRRTYKRIIPEEPRSTLLLADGRILECFVIDMSASAWRYLPILFRASVRRWRSERWWVKLSVILKMALLSGSKKFRI
jgi:hypothetical protein